MFPSRLPFRVFPAPVLPVSSSSPARALIAGCGYVGTALALRLAGEGHTVWGMRRHADALPDGVLPWPADLSDPATLRDLPPGLDSVAYTAAADGRSEAAYRAAYVDGLRNLLDALGRQGQRPRRVVFTSSTGVYAQENGEWVDEDSPTEPRSFSGRLLLEAERVLRNGPFPGVALRLGGIYGPGRERVLDEVRAGKARCPPETRWSNRIHRDDCAGALRHLLALEGPEPLYVGVDTEPAELCRVLRWVAERLNAPEPPVGDDGRARRNRSNKRCSSARLLASGYRFRYPTFREGFAALLGAERA